MSSIGQDADLVVVVVEDGQDEQVVVGHGPVISLRSASGWT
jgi:hypothetical protein